MVTEANSWHREEEVLQGHRASFPQSLRGKGLPHPLRSVAQRPSQTCRLFFRTIVAITSSMKSSVFCQGRGRGLLFSVPRFPFGKGSSQFSASAAPSSLSLTTRNFMVLLGLRDFVSFFFWSLFLIFVPPSFWKLPSYLGAGTSAFCLQILRRKLWLKGM